MKKSEIYGLVKIIKLGTAIDQIIEQLFTDDSLTKDEALLILKNNVNFIELIKQSYMMGLKAIKNNVENDGKLDWKDAMLPVIEVTDDMILSAIDEYINGLFETEKEETKA